MRGAEGFHDSRTGQSIVFTDQVRVREGEGETPHAAITRVMLHERVGHGGLNALLTDSEFSRRWGALSRAIPEADLAAIAQDYPHLDGQAPQLALEWFARQVERVAGERAGASLEGGLKGTARAMWLSLKDLMIRLFGQVSPRLQTEAELRVLIHRATRQAVAQGNWETA